MKKSFGERFWSKVTPAGDTECWLWTGFRDRNGYGRIRKGSKKSDPTRTAHRHAWEMFNGSIPDGLLVCHKCDVANCVNPAHLFLGSTADNVADRVAKGRSSNGHVGKLACKHGHLYTAATVRITSRGSRKCLICSKAYHSNWYQEHKEQLKAKANLRKDEINTQRRARRHAAKAGIPTTGK